MVVLFEYLPRLVCLGVLGFRVEGFIKFRV